MVSMRIVVGVDGSGSSMRALVWAADPPVSEAPVEAAKARAAHE
jgi:N-acetylglucosamine kinase-like BadF-type ATPase